MKNKLIASLTIIMLLFSFALCGCSKNAAKTEGASAGDKNSASETPSSEDSGYSGGDSGLKVISSDPNRKLIYDVTYDIETTGFDASVSALTELTTALNGYVESSDINSRQTSSGYAQRRVANFVLRIPAGKLNDFFDGIGSVGSILGEKLTSSDVTLEYVDTAARIDSLKAQEKSVLALLEKADGLQYVLEIQQELADIRYQIETYTSQLNKLDSLISYSRVTVKLTEVFSETQVRETPVTFGERLSDTFNKSVSRVWNGLQDFAIWLL